MQISVRSYLTVGTAAVVGAGAIALTPVLPGTAAQTAYLPAPVTAEVSLTGLNLSLTDILGILDKFGVLDITGLSPILKLLPVDLIDAITTQFLDQAGPELKAAAGDVFKYVATAAGELFLGKNSIPNQILGAVTHLPAVVAAAVGELRNGNPGAALQALTSGLLAPVTVIGQVLKQAVDSFSTYMQTTLGGLVAQLGPVLLDIVASVVGGKLGGNLQPIIDTIKNLFGGLLPGASVRVASLTVAPQGGADIVSDVQPVVDASPAAPDAPAATHKVLGPRAAAAARRAAAAVAPAAASADPSADAAEPAESSETPAAETDSVADAAPAPRTRAERSAARQARKAERSGRHSAARQQLAAAHAGK